VSKQSLLERLHEGMHRIPSVPEHNEAARVNHRGDLPHRSLQKRSLRRNPRIDHRRREPKALIGWQNAIARFFARGDK
jgi:hypothetical protein